MGLFSPSPSPPMFLCSFFPASRFPHLWPCARQSACPWGHSHRSSVFSGGFLWPQPTAEWRRWKGHLKTVRTQEVQPREAYLTLKYRAQSSRPGAAPGVGAHVLCVCYRVGNEPGGADWGSTVLLCLVRDGHIGYPWFNRCHSELPMRELNTGKVMEIALWEGREKIQIVLGGVVVCVCVCVLVIGL